MVKRASKTMAEADVSTTESWPEDGEEPEAEWYKCNDAPFRRYTKNYARLVSVRGSMGTVDEDTGTIVPPPQTNDFLKWEL
jgi:hypothetical protein